MKKNMLSFAALLVFLLLALGSGENQDSSSSAEANKAGGAPTDALSQMEVAFVGGHSRAAIKARLERAMNLYATPITEENYSRAGSALVALRKQNGVTEMDILDYMIRSHVAGMNMSFPEMAGLSAAFLVAERK